MKKLLFLAAVLISCPMFSHADPLCTNWGSGLNLCLPLSSLDAAYGYNLNAPKGTAGNQALLETQVANIKDRVAFTFGGAKSASEAAAPYLSLTYGIRNPVTDSQNILSTIRPGIYGGKRFDTREWFYGFKASANIF